MRSVLLLAMVIGCAAGSRAEPERRTDGVAAAAAVVIAVEARRWIAGDLHQHAAPFDTREGAALQVKEMAQRRAAAGLEFVIATPHLWQSTLAVADRRRAWMAKWTAMAAEARAATGITVIPGAEYTVGGFGHFGVSGVDLAALRGDDVLAAARDGGAFVVVNHPFAVPNLDRRPRPSSSRRIRAHARNGARSGLRPTTSEYRPYDWRRPKCDGRSRRSN